MTSARANSHGVCPSRPPNQPPDEQRASAAVASALLIANRALVEEHVLANTVSIRGRSTCAVRAAQRMTLLSPARRPTRQTNDGRLATAADGQCRPGCGACCIAPSISSPIPGMPDGKPAGVRCIQLTEDNRCRLFGQPHRPSVCVSLHPSSDMCGSSSAEAIRNLQKMEVQTRPSSEKQAVGNG
jgi:uncharacterized protein